MVKARHKKELKALDGTGRKLLKQANKNKAKTADAEKKIAQVCSCQPTKLLVVYLKALSLTSLGRSQSIGMFAHRGLQRWGVHNKQALS